MNNNRTEIAPDAVEKAVSGDRKALEELLTGIQYPVFHLSLRMLGSIPDAEDATQEILLKVMTHLSSFRGGKRLYHLGFPHCRQSSEGLQKAYVCQPSFKLRILRSGY